MYFPRVSRIMPLVGLPLLLSLSGCAHYRDLPPGTVREIVATPVVERTAVTAVPLPSGTEPSPSPEYVIGLNDVLTVNISGKAELSSGGGTGKVQGSRVDGSGNVHLPFVGAVKVEGLTIRQAQERVREALRSYLVDPWVVIEVAEYRSKPLYLLGRFKVPGTYYLDRPMSVLQGLALGGGFDEAANLRGARLSRDGKVLPVDIYELLTQGDGRQNVWLHNGDTIFLPDSRSQQAFIFGAVKKGGPVPIPAGGLNLAQAIATAEPRDTGFDLRYVRIIRSFSPTRGELLVVDFDRCMRGEVLPFQLVEGDIVYVPKSTFGTWNDAINEILPSLQAISSLLQPFVQIKFLRD